MAILHKQLCDTYSCSLANIGILVAHAVAQGLNQAGCDLVDVDIAHCPDSQCSDQRVWVLHILLFYDMKEWFLIELLLFSCFLCTTFGMIMPAKYKSSALSISAFLLAR